MSAQTRTIIAIAKGDGRPSESPRIKVKIAAIKASTIWLPTKAPTRSMIAKVNLETRSLRVAGTKRIPK